MGNPEFEWFGYDATWDMDKEEEIPVTAHNSRLAAEALVELMDNRSAMEYTNNGKVSVVVRVRPAQGGPTITYHVEPIHELAYYAIKKPETNEGNGE